MAIGGKSFALDVGGLPVVVEWDDEANEWRADSPDGYSFGDGPHRLIVSGSFCGKITAAERRDMLAELTKRVRDNGLEPCPEDCDCRFE